MSPLVNACFKHIEDFSLSESLIHFGCTLPIIVSPVIEVFPLMEKTLAFPAVLGLIDTGANQSLIDIQLAQQLNLLKIDERIARGINGEMSYPVYKAAISCETLEISFESEFMGGFIKKDGVGHEVLLGRDFLANTIMFYDGIRGQVTIASRRVAHLSNFQQGLNAIP